MTDLKISFGLDHFTDLCPFYLLINKEMKVVSSGDKLAKYFPFELNGEFSSFFKLVDPTIKGNVFEGLKKLSYQDITINYINTPEILLQGKVIYLADINYLLFTGKISEMDVIHRVTDDFRLDEPIPEGSKKEPEEEIATSITPMGGEPVQALADKLLEDNLLISSQLISNISNGIVMEDEHGKVILINALFCEMFSIQSKPEELTGKDNPMTDPEVLKIFKDPELALEQIKAAIQRRKKTVNVDMVLHDGRVLKWDFMPIYLGQTYKGNLWKISDITYIIVLMNKLERQKMFYENITNLVPSALAALDIHGRYLFVNPGAVKNEEIRKWMIGKTDMAYVIYRNRPLALAETRKAKFDEAIKTKSQVEWEESIVRPDGMEEFHLRKYYPVFNDSGKLEMMIAYGVDITDRKSQEELLKISEKRYREIFDYSQALVCTHDLNGKVLSVNNASSRVLEYSKEELVGQNLTNLLPENLKADFKKKYLSEISTNGKAEGVMLAISKSGKKIYLLYKNYLVNENRFVEPYVIGFSQDITERVKMEDALKKSEEKYRRIIDNMNLGMVEADLEEHMIYVNQRFCEMTGYDSEELVGKNVYDLLLSKESRDLLQEKSAQRKYGISDSYEVAVKTKRGEVRWWLISGAPFYHTDGTFKGSIGVFLDISQQKILEEELMAAKLQADRSASSKEIFLANMSHEIRTPINAILGLGKILGKTTLAKQQKQYLDSILTATENLLVIINDVLDFSKIEAGKINIENISFSMRTLLMNAKAVVNTKAEEKGLLYIEKFDNNIAPALVGDPFRINQVLMNLLSNSIKFTESGSITIKTILLEDHGEWQKIAIDVTDTGIGMSEQYIEKIFDKFTQEDASIARKYGGTGLGMSISKQLIELMGGTMNVQSIKGNGTTITLIFDFRVGDVKDLEKKKEVQADSSLLAGRNILLVEDNEMNRLVACTILEQYGAIMTVAENGLIALELVKGQTFDLILMDVQMPEMDGYQATGIIRNEFKMNVPVIALTANALKGEEEKCIAAGMDDFIPKPYDEEKLVNVIAKWIGKNQGQISLAKKQYSDMGALYDLSILESIGRGSDDFLVKLLNLFVVEVPESVRRIKEGYETGDFKTVKFYAHRIKPSVVNMNIHILRQDVADIEAMAEKGEKSETLWNLIVKLDEIIGLVVKKIIKDYNLR